MSDAVGPERDAAILIATSSSPTVRHDAILAHSERLAAALPHVGRPAAVCDLGGSSGRAARARLHAALADGFGWVLVQYNPYSFGPHGVAPWVASVFPAAATAAGARLGLLVHEAFVPLNRPRFLATGVPQRAQLAVLAHRADARAASCARWGQAVSRWSGAGATPVVATGSNVVASGLTREDARRRLGIASSALVIATFGTAHPSWMTDLVTAGVRAARATVPGPVVLLSLGDGTPQIGVGGVDERRPGALSDEEVGVWLAAGDLFLAPFVDGLSTRRGTVAAALQADLPVVSTTTAYTDAVLRESPALALTDPRDGLAYAEAVSLLAADPVLRASRSSAARTLFTDTYAWAAIAAAVDRVFPAAR